jgi:hypothetical protein
MTNFGNKLSLACHAEAPWRRRATRNRSGQAMIFLLMVLVIMLFLVLWNFDVHKILFLKSITQDGGDASALMAARWEGISLNVIGDLNIMTALAATTGDSDTMNSVSNVQARLCFVGPMIAFMASQTAAKNNNIYQNDAFTEYLQEHAQEVRNKYTSTNDDGEMLFPEPYPDCWLEYADMLDAIANEGVASGPDSASFFGDSASGMHPLLMPGFYDAIAGKAWCWFFNHQPDLLEDYTDYNWWPDVPEPPRRLYMNSEIYSLGLKKETTTLSSFPGGSDGSLLSVINDIQTEQGLATVSSNALASNATWFCYGDLWGSWTDLLEGDDESSGSGGFPWAGIVKEQYDYVGSDAAVRLEASAERITPGEKGAVKWNTITWTSAAKPFGSLNETERPDSYQLVIPAFTQVALIPLDASTASGGGSYDIAWRRHIEHDLQYYLALGPDWIFSSCPDPDCDENHLACFYCAQLIVWEIEAFREEGLDWLEINSWRCIIPPGPGPGGKRGGGSRRGH